MYKWRKANRQEKSAFVRCWGLKSFKMDSYHSMVAFIKFFRAEK